MSEVTTKVCTKCKEKKRLSAFWKDKRNRTGLTARCGSCLKQHYLKYKEKNRDKYKKYHRASHLRALEKNPNHWREISKQNVEMLNSVYIKRQLIRSGLTKELIELHPELIEMKRIEIKILRELKNTNK